MNWDRWLSPHIQTLRNIMNEPKLLTRQKVSIKCSINLKHNGFNWPFMKKSFYHSLLYSLLHIVPGMLLGICCDMFWKDNCIEDRVLSREIQLCKNMPLDMSCLLFFKHFYQDMIHISYNSPI